MADRNGMLQKNKIVPTKAFVKTTLYVRYSFRWNFHLQSVPFESDSCICFSFARCKEAIDFLNADWIQTIYSAHNIEYQPDILETVCRLMRSANVSKVVAAIGIIFAMSFLVGKTRAGILPYRQL